MAHNGRMKGPLLLLVVLLVAGGLAYYFLGGLQQAGVKEFRLTGVGGLTAETFTLLGDLVVSNPSRVAVPFDKIDYLVVLPAGGQTIAQGTLPGGTIAVGEATLPISIDVRWDSVLGLVPSLMGQEKVDVEVQGRLFLAGQGIPFRGTLDVKQVLAGKAAQGLLA